MNNRKKHLLIGKFLVPFFIAAGLLIAPMAVNASSVAQQADQAQQEKAQQAKELKSVSGTVLVQEEAGEQTYYLDIDGDGTEDFQLEFTSGSQRSAMPDAGEQVTVKGQLQGQKLHVQEIEKQ